MMFSRVQRMVRPVMRSAGIQSTTINDVPLVFANWGVYNPDRVEIVPIPPIFRKLDRGTAYALKREGSVMVALSPHNGQMVDFNKKVQFSLSPVEAAEFIDVLNKESGHASFERNIEGYPKRSMEVHADPESPGAVKISIEVEESGRVAGGLSKYEFAVARKVVDHCIPYLCGANRVLDRFSAEVADGGFSGSGGNTNAAPDWAAF